MAYAHSQNPRSEWHGLVDHLRAVAETTAEFADVFGARDYGYWLGLWHDVGKFDPDFQRYLRGRGHGVDHKRAGARLAQRLGLFALAIQGHHGGMGAFRELTNWLDSPDRPNATGESLARRRAKDALAPLEPSAIASLPTAVTTAKDPRLASEFLLRLLYSALVDADHLDTEAHFEPTRAERRGADVAMPTLWERFEARHRELDADAPHTSVNDIRREIYAACIEAADGSRGFYRLTAPTGAGKTLSVMAFALRHALRHGLRRVIVAAPFISITEQTAQAYRQAFAPLGDAVLEHHSGAYARESDEFVAGADVERTRLAAENWDAPIIVTTAVQLFESLFANTPQRCRKVHRLAGSVLILDEAQALPSHVLAPILDVLRSLTSVGQATVVLSTATQPGLREYSGVPRPPAQRDRARASQALRRLAARDLRLARPRTLGLDPGRQGDAVGASGARDRQHHQRRAGTAGRFGRPRRLAPVHATLRGAPVGRHRTGQASPEARSAVPPRSDASRRGRRRPRLPVGAARTGAAGLNHSGGRALQPRRDVGVRPRGRVPAGERFACRPGPTRPRPTSLWLMSMRRNSIRSDPGQHGGRLLPAPLPSRAG